MYWMMSGTEIPIGLLASYILLCVIASMDISKDVLSPVVILLLFIITVILLGDDPVIRT
jgi:hypothetical protein